MTDRDWQWGVSNAGADALLIWLEPWAEEFEVPPGSTLTLSLPTPEDALEEIECTAGQVVLWAKAGQTVRISIDGIVQQSASADIVVPAGLDGSTKKLMTVMFEGLPQARLGGVPHEARAPESLWRRANALSRHLIAKVIP